MRSAQLTSTERTSLAIALLFVVMVTRISGQTTQPRPYGGPRRPATSYDVALAELRAAYASTEPARTASHSVRTVPTGWNPYTAQYAPRTTYQPRPADLAPALPRQYAIPQGYPLPQSQRPAEMLPNDALMYAPNNYASPNPYATPQPAPYFNSAVPTQAPVMPRCPSQADAYTGVTYQPVGYYQPIGLPPATQPLPPTGFGSPYPPAPLPPVGPFPGGYPGGHDPYQGRGSKYYVGDGLFGQPKLFVDGQPVRNAIRSILP